jgi:molybdenum cofactor biosynthesis enzyme MoaA
VRQVYRLLKLNSLVRGHRAKFAGVFLAHTFGFRHLAIRFDPVMACNLRCTMCAFSNEDYVRGLKGRFTVEEIERLAASFFSRALLVVFGCGTEPTVYKNFPELVRIAKRHRVPNVSMTTNAQLIKAEHIEKLIDYGLDELTISVHGTTRETYEKFMVGASFDKLHEVLGLLEDAKARRGVRSPMLRINYTVNSENLDELDTFFDIFGRYTIGTLQVRPVMDIRGQYRTPLDAAELPRYNKIIAALGEKCREHGIIYLANTVDPTYEAPNDGSVVLQAVHRYIGPMDVWQRDFDWRNETYMQYCRRIGWGRYLLRCAMSDLDKVRTRNAELWGKYAVKYEVNF